MSVQYTPAKNKAGLRMNGLCLSSSFMSTLRRSMQEYRTNLCAISDGMEVHSRRPVLAELLRHLG